MDVSVIMINYNTEELTRNAVNSIFEHTSGLEYEVILIDNASPDGSGDKLAAEFEGRIEYIQSGGNLGTSKAFNLGLKKSSGKYVLWLNTDILFRDNFIGTLFQYMEEHPDCGICGGNLLDFDGNPAHSYDKHPMTVKNIKHNMSLIRFVFRKLIKKRLNLYYNYSGAPMRVSGVLGADMMIRRAVFDQIGNFEEKIFMYCEETEFAYRMQKMTNYSVMSIPSAVMYHFDGASFTGQKKTFSARRHRAMISGNLVYFRKHFGEKEELRYLKLLVRSYSKFLLISRLLFMKSKVQEYKSKKQIAKEFLQERKEVRQ